MGRGRGVRLQRYKDGGLCNVKIFKAADGLSSADAAGRAFSLALKELADWRGNRADAGRLAPKGFPRSNKFGGDMSNGNARGQIKVGFVGAAGTRPYRAARHPQVLSLSKREASLAQPRRQPPRCLLKRACRRGGGLRP